MKTFSVQGLCLSTALLTLTLVGQAQAQFDSSFQPATTNLTYALPTQFAGSAVGSTIVYGGFNYIVNAGKTMSLAPLKSINQPDDVQKPLPGMSLTYQGNTYVVNADGTMTQAPCFQLPTGFISNPQQSIYVGGNVYVINDDGTMSPVPRYQVPTNVTTKPGGTRIAFNSVNYTFNADGTVSPGLAKSAGNQSGTATQAETSTSNKVPAPASKSNPLKN